MPEHDFKRRSRSVELSKISAMFFCLAGDFNNLLSSQWPLSSDFVYVFNRVQTDNCLFFRSVRLSSSLEFSATLKSQIFFLGYRGKCLSKSLRFWSVLVHCDLPKTVWVLP